MTDATTPASCPPVSIPLSGDITPEPSDTDWNAFYIAFAGLLEIMETKMGAEIEKRPLRNLQRSAAIISHNDCFMKLRAGINELRRIDPQNPDSPFHS